MLLFFRILCVYLYGGGAGGDDCLCLFSDIRFGAVEAVYMGDREKRLLEEWCSADTGTAGYLAVLCASGTRIQRIYVADRIVCRIWRRWE